MSWHHIVLYSVFQNIIQELHGNARLIICNICAFIELILCVLNCNYAERVCGSQEDSTLTSKELELKSTTSFHLMVQTDQQGTLTNWGNHLPTAIKTCYLVSVTV